MEATQNIKSSLQVTPGSRFQHVPVSVTQVRGKPTDSVPAEDSCCLLLIFSQQNNTTGSAQPLCSVGPALNLVLADDHCTPHQCWSSRCSNCAFKARFLHPLLCALACVILGCINHALNLHSRGCCSSFPSHTSPLSPSSQF